MTITPTTAWPRRRSGSYPGVNFAAYVYDNGDPLSVAWLVAERRIEAAVRAEAAARVAAGALFCDALDWAAIESRTRRAAAWKELCSSFDAVIAALETELPKAWARRLIDEARARQGGAT